MTVTTPNPETTMHLAHVAYRRSRLFRLAAGPGTKPYQRDYWRASCRCLRDAQVRRMTAINALLAARYDSA